MPYLNRGTDNFLGLVSFDGEMYAGWGSQIVPGLDELVYIEIHRKLWEEGGYAGGGGGKRERARGHRLKSLMGGLRTRAENV